MATTKRCLKVLALAFVLITAVQVRTASATDPACVDWCYVQRDICMTQCLATPYPGCTQDCRNQLFQCIAACP